MRTEPGIVHFHGGGWILGDKDTHDRLTRELAVETEAASSSWTTTARQRPVPGRDRAGMRLHDVRRRRRPRPGHRPRAPGRCRHCVGGTMAAAVTLPAKARGGPALVLQVLLYPVTDANFEDTSSTTSFATRARPTPASSPRP